MNRPIVYVICGVHNHLSATKQLIASLERQTYRSINIIIVDDGSTDGTKQYFKRKSKITVLSGDGTLWWTGAISMGVENILKKAHLKDFILTINNDCTFPRDYISLLVTQARENHNYIIGSLVIDSRDNNSIVDGGVIIDWENSKLVQLGPGNIKSLPKSEGIRTDINTLSTKGTIFPVRVFKQIGNFDRKIFPHYLSDYEFACRAKKSGFKLALSLKARVYNNPDNTGIRNTQEKYSISEAWNLLFSRKSKVNLVDNFNFIRLYCPPRFKVNNYIRLFSKLIVGVKNVELRI